jgi:hypothetical protein
MTVYENLVTNYGDQFRGDILSADDGSTYSIHLFYFAVDACLYELV